MAALNNGPAEIVDMEDARARRRSGELPLGEYAHVGALLNAVRANEGLSLEEAALKTHIKEYHLAAIEKMDVNALPGRPYAIGFVKVYAAYLGLDPEPVVIRFKEEAEYTAPQEIDVEKFEAAETALETDAGRLSLWAVAGVAAFIIWCAWQVTRPHEVTMLGAPQGFPPRADPQSGPAVTDPAAAAAVAIEAEIVNARIVERVEPVYPRGCAASAAPVETVTIDYVIRASGRVSSERISHSSNRCFDAAALNAIKRWQFEPRTVDGAARAAYDQKYSFSFQRPR